MIALELLGLRATNKAMPPGAFTVDGIRRTYADEGRITWRGLIDLARQRGRVDIADALEESFRRTDSIMKILETASRLTPRFLHKFIRRTLLRGSFR